MLARLLRLWQWIRTSLWSLPLLMVLCAVAAAVAALKFPILAGGDPVWWLYSGSAKQAPEFLSGLVSAMITMGTLVISITMVVLTLAAQQLGPRLIHSFTADRRTQVCIGLFIATIVYLLLVLRSAYGTVNQVSNLAVTIGTVFVLLSVIVLPLFVHHLARTIVSDTVIWRVGRSLDAAARNLLPAEDEEREAPAAPEQFRGRGLPIRLHGSGYIQVIDHARLVECAQSLNAMIALELRAGHHTIAGTVVGWITPVPEDGDAVAREINDAILLGSERTPLQDIEYPILQLVEVALRALSPGINDPHTAVASIDRLGQSIGLIMRRGPAPQTWRDENHVIRVISSASTFEGIVDAAFNEIRQVGGKQPSILIRLAETLTQLAEVAPPQHRDVLQRHLSLVLEAGRRNIESTYDLKQLEERIDPTGSLTG